MHKIDAPGFAPGNEFTEGNPQTGTPATTVGAKWLTTVQRELVNVVEDAGITLDDTIDNQLLQAIKLLGGGGSIGNRNLCGNPHMQIDSRWGVAGITKLFSAPGDYVIDRWWVRPDTVAGSGAGNVSLATMAFGVAGFEDGHPKFELRYDVTVDPTIADGYRIGQHLYGMDQFSGETVTWSIWLRTESGVAEDFTMRITVDYGAGGSADDVVVATIKSVSGSSAKHEVTGTFPSFFGKTLGSGPKIIIEIESEESTSDGLLLTQSQLEVGSSSTSFTKPDGATLLMQAARHWSTSYRDGERGVAGKFDGNLVYRMETSGTEVTSNLGVVFQVPMRKIPSITWHNPTTGTGDRINVGGVEKTVTSSQGTTEKTAGTAIFTGATTGKVLAHYTAEGEQAIA